MPGQRLGVGPGLAHLDDVAEHVDADLPSSSLATVPAATRAAVSRAEARSSTSRASSSPYLSIPARSACPGRGWVRTLEGRPGAGDISSSHFGHSVLAISMATGDPRVRPWRMPADQAHLVDLEAHAGAAAEAQPAAGEPPLDVLGRDQQAGRHALEDHHEGASVGLSGGQVAQHPDKSTRGGRGPRGPAGRNTPDTPRPAVRTRSGRGGRPAGHPRGWRSRRRRTVRGRRGSASCGRPTSRPSSPGRTRADHEAGQEGQVDVDEAQVADGHTDDPGQADVAEAHARGHDEPDERRTRRRPPHPRRRRRRGRARCGRRPTPPPAAGR